MNIPLGDHIDRWIQEQGDSGRYANASEVVKAGLRLLEAREREDWLLAAIDEADAEVARGETVAFTPELMAELKRGALAEIRANTPVDDAVTA